MVLSWLSCIGTLLVVALVATASQSPKGSLKLDFAIEHSKKSLASGGDLVERDDGSVLLEIFTSGPITIVTFAWGQTDNQSRCAWILGRQIFG